ncbi:MAG: 4-hydroxy-tetrahydrodipicolinate synthase [Candidatus Bathyarchaeota archaeon]|nr:4-hydroxy-tetrahydrodipicolinate synthase [Candidatus Bathyarchaeota archaeon]MDH5791390.1 4-hydroxy-tetrahydrodipicolinate synthase [Candidatus Bathyarchaeota archaeon]
MELKGIYVPNVTPFDRHGRIDEPALADLIEFWLGEGVSGLVVNASTGEGPLLSREEKRRLIGLVMEKVDGRATVIAGTGAIGTRETIELTQDARDLGAEAALVTTPFFFAPSNEELFQHYASLIASVGLPVILYNVPKFTGYSIAPRVVEHIARECSGLVGIKDSSSNPGTMAEIIRLMGDRISVLSGAADMTMPTLAMGGKGAILAVANVVPGTCVDLYKAALRGDLREAGVLQLRVSYVNKVLVREHSQIAAVKAALGFMGHPAGVPRRPLLPLPKKEELEVYEALKETELF